MVVKTPISGEALLAVVTILFKYVPALSAETLVRALQSYDETAAASPRRKTCTVKEACAILGLSRPTVTRLAVEGKIRRIDCGKGRYVRYDLASINDFADGRA